MDSKNLGIALFPEPREMRGNVGRAGHARESVTPSQQNRHLLPVWAVHQTVRHPHFAQAVPSAVAAVNEAGYSQQPKYARDPVRCRVLRDCPF